MNAQERRQRRAEDKIVNGVTGVVGATICIVGGKVLKMCYHSNPLSGPDTEEARQILENLFALLEVASVFLFLAAAVTLMYGIAIRPKSVDENGAGSDDSDDQPADRLPSKDAREAYHFSEDESIGTPLSSRDEIEHELRKCR